MTSRIRVLDEITINKIAAGEVIENPASVVKELVENSLDAGATDIHIEIAGGGRQLIRVTDNGCGMSNDDALLSLERHATSKMRAVDDLEMIGTMGFRGEAVPSIASISKFTLLTAMKKGEATLVVVEGGKIVKCCSAVREPGTTIEVKNLFFNVPVRRKFQRSPAYDSAEVLKVVTVLALAHSNARFQLVSDQTNILNAAATEKLVDRIHSVLGSEYSQALCEVDVADESCQARGFVGVPTYTRPNRNGQYLFVNKRAVFSPLVSAAVREGYGTALPTNRYPVFVLYLTLPGDLVDVNVHPQKREVRLRQEGQIKQLLSRAVSQALVGANYTPETHQNIEPPPLPSFPRIDRGAFSMPPPIFREAIELPRSFPVPHIPTVRDEAPDWILPTTQCPPKVLVTLQGYILLDPATCHSVPQGGDPGTGIYLLDQRAAHHRVLFDRLTKKGRHVEVEQLLIPQTLDLGPTEAAVLRESLSSLREMGLGIEDFGQNTFLVNAIPRDLVTADVGSLVTEIVQELRDHQNSGRVALEAMQRMALAASRAAISRKQWLSTEEAQQLVAQLFATESPYQCPQGRRTIVFLGKETMARLFQK